MIRSKHVTGFFTSNPKLTSAVEEVLDQVFLHPSRAPNVPHDNGVVLTADRPRFNKNPLLNIEKPTYLRQSFAKSVKLCDEHKLNELYAAAPSSTKKAFMAFISIWFFVNSCVKCKIIIE